MVRILRLKFLLVFFLFSSGLAFSQDVKVTSNIEDEKGYEGFPIKGTITITHDRKQEIDISSFKLSGKAIKAVKVKEVPLSADSPLIISIFSFELPAQNRGLYILPPVSVKVGREEYQSISSTYEVVGSAPKKETATVATLPKLKLEALINGPVTLYPKQKTWFVYRFYFTGNIELTSEELPLLEAKGFKKVGDKIIKDSQEAGWAVQEIQQQVEAIAPGSYTFPSAKIEGFAYTVDPVSKKKSYLQPKLQAEAPPTTVTVVPFPTENKPANFSDALGQFTIQSALVTPSETYVESKMVLKVDVFTRDGTLDNVFLPDLSRQPGFQGVFRMSDLPPVGTITGNNKSFTVELYPLSTSVKEIPSISITSFDSSANRYETVKSDPIPIHVVERPKESKAVEKKEPEKQIEEPQIAPVPETPSRIEIEGNEPLNEQDMFNKFFGTWMALWLLPFAITALLIELVIWRKLEQKKKIKKTKSSQEIWDEAIKQPKGSSENLRLLYQAMLQRLQERGFIQDASIPIEQLPTDGEAGSVREILMRIEELRFAGAPESSIRQEIDKAEALFAKVNK